MRFLRELFLIRYGLLSPFCWLRLHDWVFVKWERSWLVELGMRKIGYAKHRCKRCGKHATRFITT